MVRTQIQLPDAVDARARRVVKAKKIAADWTPPRVRSVGVTPLAADPAAPPTARSSSGGLASARLPRNNQLNRLVL